MRHDHKNIVKYHEGLQNKNNDKIVVDTLITLTRLVPILSP